MSMDLLLGLWELVCVGAAAFLIWGLTTAHCRLCCGAGRLALEAYPPGEACFMVDVDCPGCGHLGALGSRV